MLEVKLNIWRDEGASISHHMRWADISFSDEVWETVIPILETGLYFYNYEFIFVDGKKIFGGENEFDLTENYNRQLIVYSSEFDVPDCFYGAMIYHIFVDRFRNSGRVKAKEGAVINSDWYGAVPKYPEYPGAYINNNEFFGGDLWGVIEKLPYIQSLGIDYIYLSPVFDALSNHKYDTGDYLSVDEMFGGDDALLSLIFEAEKLGIKIILDGVFNHTGDNSVYFNKYGNYNSIGAYNSKHSPYYRWYSFKNYPNEYECWWGISILPRVNSSDTSYIDFIMNKVVYKWMQAGIAGWRLDVADELSDVFLEKFRSSVKSYSSDAIIIGEVWEDATNKISYGVRRRYLQGSQLDSVMNYPFRNAVIGYIRDGNISLFTETVCGICRRYPEKVLNSLMNFLGTHDTERIITVLGGESADGHTNSELAYMRMTEEQLDLAKHLLILAFLMIAHLPGSLSVYYGDEIGMEGYRDPFAGILFLGGMISRKFCLSCAV